MNTLDNNQKSKQIRQRFFGVYVLPIVFGVTICGLAYLLTNKYNLDKNDSLFSYILGIAAGIMLYFRNRFKWLPLPDGSYIQTKKLTEETNHFKLDKNSYTNEPTSYIAQYYYSQVSKTILLVCGIAMICGGIYIISKSSIIFPCLIVIGGIFLFYSGFKEIIDTSPKLKLAKEGLWTKELGFKPWTSINKTKIKVEKGSRSSQVYLEIYLNECDLNYPKQRLLLNDIKNKDKIKPMIDELFIK